jgi:hypothetical protein
VCLKQKRACPWQAGTLLSLVAGGVRRRVDDDGVARGPEGQCKLPPRQGVPRPRWDRGQRLILQIELVAILPSAPNGIIHVKTMSKPRQAPQASAPKRKQSMSTCLMVSGSGLPPTSLRLGREHCGRGQQCVSHVQLHAGRFFASPNKITAVDDLFLIAAGVQIYLTSAANRHVPLPLWVLVV